MFWSGAKIEAEGQTIIDRFDKSRIDCAAYALTMGEECYLTQEPSSRKLWPSPTRLKPGNREEDYGQGFRIKPGQFAYLLTAETIKLPANILAFISLKATYKWKGLLNVSGFHVDPGYFGRLVYAVYNAGPTDIMIRRGEQLFLIWFAELMSPDSNYVYKKPGLSQIDSKFMGHAAGEVMSLPQLARRVEKLSAAVTAFSISTVVVLGFVALIVTLFAALIVAPDAIKAMLPWTPHG